MLLYCKSHKGLTVLAEAQSADICYKHRPTLFLILNIFVYDIMHLLVLLINRLAFTQL
jgi:hypothetical protein